MFPFEPLKPSETYRIDFLDKDLVYSKAWETGQQFIWYKGIKINLAWHVRYPDIQVSRYIKIMKSWGEESSDIKYCAFCLPSLLFSYIWLSRYVLSYHSQFSTWLGVFQWIEVDRVASWTPKVFISRVETLFNLQSPQQTGILLNMYLFVIVNCLSSG